MVGGCFGGYDGVFSDGVTTAVFGELSFYISLVIFAGAIVMAFRKVHPVLIIVASAIIGIAAGCVLEL